jgi:hypothetical protein
LIGDNQPVENGVAQQSMKTARHGRMMYARELGGRG